MPALHPQPSARFLRLGLAALVLVSIAAGTRLPVVSALSLLPPATRERVDLEASPRSHLIIGANMAPGDSAAGALTVRNDGGLPFRYALTVAGGQDELVGALRLAVWAAVDGGCARAPERFLYGPAPIDERRGIDIGDTALAAGADETLCVQLSLPLTADNRYQERASGLFFTLDAEQAMR